MKIFFFLGTAIILSGCMHSVMMSGHSNEHSSENVVLEKEVLKGTIKVTAIIPSLEVNKESEMTVSLFDTSTNQLISGASVSAEFELQANNHEHSSHDTQNKKYELNAREKSNGVYVLSHTPSEAGTYAITISVSLSGDNLDSPIILEATKTVLPASTQNNHGSMHGSSSSSTALIIGGAFMAIMMLGMMVVGRGTF